MKGHGDIDLSLLRAKLNAYLNYAGQRYLRPTTTGRMTMRPIGIWLND